MALEIARHFDVRLTQGSADAFVQDTVVTGLLPSDGLAYVITRAEIMYNFIPGLTNALQLQWSITRDTKTAIADYSDPDTLYSDAFGVRVTTSGTMLYEQRREIIFPDGLFVVEPYIYCQYDSANTAVSGVLDMRLWYTTQKLTEVEILRLLNNV